MSIAEQLTGMRGVYLVAAELPRRGFVASPTSRSAIGADILVTDQACSRTYSIQGQDQFPHLWLLARRREGTYDALPQPHRRSRQHRFTQGR
jgi:hypothetical protein